MTPPPDRASLEPCREELARLIVTTLGNDFDVLTDRSQAEARKCADAILAAGYRRAAPRAGGEMVVPEELVRRICASVENQANWDKPPYSGWYYELRRIEIQRALAAGDAGKEEGKL